MDSYLVHILGLSLQYILWLIFVAQIALALESTNALCWLARVDVGASLPCDRHGAAI